MSAGLSNRNDELSPNNRTYHFCHMAVLKTRSIVLEQGHAISNGAETRDIIAIPDDVVQLVVIGRLHASKLFVGTETIAAELLCQDCEPGGVCSVDLAGGAGLRNYSSDDGVVRIGVAV